MNITENVIKASTTGHLDIVKILLKKGSDINSTNNIGDTPLHEGKILFGCFLY